MVKNSSDFYLMKTAGSYKSHVSGEYSSSLSLEVEVKQSHTGSSVVSSRARTTVRTTSSRTTSSNISTTNRGSSSSSGGGY